MIEPIVAALVLIGILAIVTIWRRKVGRGRTSSGSLHSMGRDDTVSYFRDYGASSAPGVREEDRTTGWGEDDAGPR